MFNRKAADQGLTEQHMNKLIEQRLRQGESVHRRIVENKKESTTPRQREYLRRLEEKLKTHIDSQIKKGDISEYEWTAMKKFWKVLAGDQRISDQTLNALLGMDTDHLQKFLQRKMKLADIDHFVSNKKEFLVLAVHELHVYDEDRTLFEKRLQRLEDLLESRTSAVRERILSIDRTTLRDALLLRRPAQTIRDFMTTGLTHPGNGQDTQAIQQYEHEMQIRREANLVVRMMQATPEEVQLYHHKMKELRSKLTDRDPEKRETFEKILKLNPSAIFNLLTGKVEAHELVRYFDRKEIWRIVQLLQPARPTKEQLQELPPGQRQRAERVLHEWDREYARRCILLENDPDPAKRTTMDQWWNKVLDGLITDPKEEYRGVRGQMIKLGTDNPLALQRIQLLLLDFTTPENFTINQLNEKLDMLQQIVAPEHFIPLMLRVVPKPEDPFSMSSARLPTLSDIIHSQKGTNVYTSPYLGKHAVYHVHFHISDGNLLLMAQSGGGKTNIIEWLMQRSGEAMSKHGRQQGQEAVQELHRKLVKDAKGEGASGVPESRTLVVMDPKGGELSRETIDMLAQMGYDVRVISYDDPYDGLLQNPLADIPRVNGPVQLLEGRIRKAQHGLDQRTAALKQANTAEFDNYTRFLAVERKSKDRLIDADKDINATKTKLAELQSSKDFRALTQQEQDQKLQPLQQELQRLEQRRAIYQKHVTNAHNILESILSTRVDFQSYQRAYDLVTHLQEQLNLLNNPKEREARIAAQDRAASEFAHLWVRGISPTAIANASINTSITESHVILAIKAAAIAARETDPHAPLYRLAEILRDRESFEAAINSSPSGIAKRIIGQQLVKIFEDKESSDRLFALLRDSTKGLSIDSIRRVTSGNEMSSRDLVNGNIVVFVKLDYRRFTQEELAPIISTQIGMMKYTIEQEKIQRIHEHRNPGAKIDFIWEEYPIFAPYINLEKELGIIRSPADISNVILGQDDQQFSERVNRLVSNRIYTNVSPQQAETISQMLGTHLVYYKNQAKSLQEAHEMQYRRAEPSLGLNSISTEVYQHGQTEQTTEGQQQTRELLLTPQQIQNLLAQKGMVLYMRGDAPPMFIRVPLMRDPNKPMQLGFDGEARTGESKISTGIKRPKWKDPSIEVWGRRPGQHIIRPTLPGEIAPLTDEDISQITDQRTISNEIALRQDKIAQLETYIATMRFYLHDRTYLDENTPKHDSDTEKAEEIQKLQHKIDLAIKNAKQKRDIFKDEIDRLDQHRQTLRKATVPQNQPPPTPPQSNIQLVRAENSTGSHSGVQPSDGRVVSPTEQRVVKARDGLLSQQESVRSTANSIPSGERAPSSDPSIRSGEAAQRPHSQPAQQDGLTPFSSPSSSAGDEIQTSALDPFSVELQQLIAQGSQPASVSQLQGGDGQSLTEVLTQQRTPLLPQATTPPDTIDEFIRNRGGDNLDQLITQTPQPAQREPEALPLQSSQPSIQPLQVYGIHRLDGGNQNQTAAREWWPQAPASREQEGLSPDRGPTSRGRRPQTPGEQPASVIPQGNQPSVGSQSRTTRGRQNNLTSLEQQPGSEEPTWI